MVRLLLNTDTCIGILRRNSPHAFRELSRLEYGEAAMSVITWGELARGAQLSREAARAYRGLDQFARIVPALPMPVRAGTVYGQIRALLEKRGRMIGNNDLWIASHALAEDLTVVTGNVGEFGRVDGLRVNDWLRG